MANEPATSLLQCPTVRDMLRHPAALRQIASVASSAIDPVRMVRIIPMAFRDNPMLADADAMSFLGALMTSASLGLMPNTTLGEAYLIPFRNSRKSETAKRDVYDITFVIGFKGMVKLARRSGGLINIHADVVTKQEWDAGFFEFEYGTNQRLVHKAMHPEGEPMFAYAHALLKDGEAFLVWPYSKVLAHRDRYSQAYRRAVSKAKDKRFQWMLDETPWVKHEAAMARKTMIRQLCPMLDLTVDGENALQVDDSRNLDFARFAIEASGPGEIPEIIDEDDPGEDAGDDKPAESAGKAPQSAESGKGGKGAEKAKAAAQAPAAGQGDGKTDKSGKSGKGKADEPEGDLLSRSNGEPEDPDREPFADLATTIIEEIGESAEGDAGAVAAIMGIYDQQLQRMQEKYPDLYEQVEQAAESHIGSGAG